MAPKTEISQRGTKDAEIPNFKTNEVNIIKTFGDSSL